MADIIILLFIVLLGPLAIVFGADSRTWDDRGWWPGTPRRDWQPPTRGTGTGPRAGVRSAAGWFGTNGLKAKDGTSHRIPEGHAPTRLFKGRTRLPGTVGKP
jgi:hypothetical protein